jgi:ABC-type multidrug transport system ATPase subunit
MITVHDLSKKFSDEVLTHLNFSIEDNEIVGLVGGNGAGRSTLLQIIAGELKPDTGVVNLYRLYDLLQSFTLSSRYST